MVKYADPLDGVFHALADSTRRTILTRLAARGRTITEIAEPFDMSLPAVSKHVRVLERAGLVRRTRDGRMHRIQLDAAPLRGASSWIDCYRGFWNDRLDCLAELLKEKE